jgi:hypothetical protein
MDYQKPYKIETNGNDIFLINGSTGEKEYEVVSSDLSQPHWYVSAINRVDKIKIPTFRVNDESIASLKESHPEFFL